MPHVAVVAGSNLNGYWTTTEVIVTISPWGIGFPSHLALGHARSVPSLPVGAGAKDSEGAPFVGDCGGSRPVVCSVGGLVVDSEVEELDDEPDAELGTLGCTTQEASSKTSTVVAIPNRMV
jgi:hypothetical protein